MNVNKNIEGKLPITEFNKYYVVADFDRTITGGASKTSWSILAGSDLVPDSYINEREELYAKYRPIELDESMDFDERSRLVSEWFRKHIELFVKYQISEEIFKKAAEDLRIMEFREGADEFLKFLYENNIPLIIISAGIGNFIETFLKKNNCYYDNIYVSSNKIAFENGVASRVDKNIIHSLNKNEVSLPDEIKKWVKDRPKVILLGDQISDLKMVDESRHEEVIKVGFYSTRAEVPISDYEKYFDVVLTDEENYKTLSRKLFRK